MSLGHPSYAEVLIIVALGVTLFIFAYQSWARFDDHPRNTWRAWLTRAVVFVVALGVIALAIHTLFTPTVCGEFCDNRQY